MTLEDLRKSLQNFMPEWCEIECTASGEIVIHTRLKEAANGELISIDDEELTYND